MADEVVLTEARPSLKHRCFIGLFRAGAVLLVGNEIRGLVLSVPILYAMYQMGGTAMAIGLGFCSLGGIALSIFVPIVVAKKLQKRLLKR